MRGGERILVVGPAWVGDMVMAQCLLKLLRERNPDARISVLAPDWSHPLLARMPEVDEAVRLPLGHGSLNLRVRWQIGRSLRGWFDRAIVLPRSLKAALVPWFAEVPVRTGYLGEYRYRLINDVRPLDKQALPRVVDRYVNLGLAPDEPFDRKRVAEPKLRVDPQGRATARRELGLDISHPVIAFMPGAEYGRSKRWPVAHYAALARALLTRGFHVWILGSERDREVSSAIVRQGGGGITDLTGRTTIDQVVDILSLVTAAVSNDSGLMHVAAAVGIPLVAVYGSTTPDYTPPLTAKAVTVYDRLDCSPCFRRTCPRGHYACLEEIQPEQVLRALERALDLEHG